MNPKTVFPQLEFDRRSYHEILKTLRTQDCLIIADPFHRKELAGFFPVIFPDSNDISEVKVILENHSYDSIIAIGGCTALDIGRACAKNENLIVIPTILSTSCISINQSVLSNQGIHRAEITRAPQRVIIPIEVFSDCNNPLLIRFAASGFGDFFSGLSAGIDFWFRRGELDSVKIKQIAKLSFNGLKWVSQKYEKMNYYTLRRLAKYSHFASLTAIDRGNTHLNAGGEHHFYYAVRERDVTKKVELYHGEIVSFGTLMTLWLYGKEKNYFSWFDDYLSICKKLSLPYTESTLREKGLTLQIIEQSVKDIEKKGSFLGMKMGERNFYQEMGEMFNHG